jgi:hypothetical protein
LRYAVHVLSQEVTMAAEWQKTSQSDAIDAPDSASGSAAGDQAMEPSDSQRRRTALALHLLDEWMADESGYDETTWPELKAALDRDRLSSRRLFDD